MIGAQTRDGIKLPHQHLLSEIHQPNKNLQTSYLKKKIGRIFKNTDVTKTSLM
jgi:hypothetical protein